MSEVWVNEQLSTTINLCRIALLLFSLKKKELLPTILEAILLEAQDMVDDYCVVNNA